MSSSDDYNINLPDNSTPDPFESSLILNNNLISSNQTDSAIFNSDNTSSIHHYSYLDYYNYGFYNTSDIGQEYGPDPSDKSIFETVQRCHMHRKPDLNCKFCRKYKSSVHEISRLAQKQQMSQQTEDKRNQLPMTNTATFNMNTLLRNNILSSEYYKSLSSMQYFHEIVDEIVQYATHAEPYCSTATRAPSTLFCCLYKLFTMKLTEKQMLHLLDNSKSPYPRCCGFLYLRYVLPPDKLWMWFEPYFLDDEVVIISADQQSQVTIGKYVEDLLMNDKYFNTVLPRLPVRIKNLIGVQLLEMEGHRRRRITNLDIIDDFHEGALVSVCSKGDWLDGEIICVKDGNYEYPLVSVLLEDGTEETLDIGYVSLKSIVHEHHDSDSVDNLAHKKYISHSEDHVGRHLKHRKKSETDASPNHIFDKDEEYRKVGGKSGNREDLIREFRRREREKALAIGKEYARRPTSYKSSLSSRLDAKHERICKKDP